MVVWFVIEDVCLLLFVDGSRDLMEETIANVVQYWEIEV